MDKTYTVKVTSTISAPPSRVWEALTKAELIKQYLFGTETITDWRKGSAIVWKGSWQGKRYEDKGKILKIEPEKVLETTYWSSMSGLEDKPENYKRVTYELSPENAGTRLTLTQDNNATEDEKNHSEQNWKMVLEGLKKLIEQS